MIDFRPALRGGITHHAVNQQVPHPAEPAEVQRASNGLHIAQPDMPFSRRIGRRCLRLIRQLALPFLARLQARVSSGVDSSASAQVLRKVLSSQRAMENAIEVTQRLAKQVLSSQQSINARLEAMEDAIQVTQQLSSKVVEYSSKLLQARAISLGNEVLARSPFGWLLLPSEDLHLVQIMLETGGSLEPGTVAVIQALLQPNDLAIDVGANVGALTIAMARSVAPHGHVLAVEPTPRTAELLRRTCALTGLQQIIQVEACAVGAKDGTGKLAIGVTSGHNSLLPLDNATGNVEVRVRPLDALVPATANPALVKIDAEGFELEVWRGMERVLRDAPDLAVIVEFGPTHLLRSGVTIEDWFAELTAPGFTPWEIDEASGAIRPLRSSGLQGVLSMNLLLLRDLPSRWRRLRIET